MRNFVLIFIFAFPVFSAAKQIEFDEREVSILIRYEVTDQRAGSNPTYLRFPRAISRVDNATKFSIKSASPAGTEPDYRELEVRPRFMEGVQKVEVLLNDGSVVRLKLKITQDLKAPSSYDFEPKRTLEDTKDTTKPGQITDLNVLRSVLQGETPPGMRRHTYERELNCQAPSLGAVLKRTFESDLFKIYQIEISNESQSREYRFREENIILKGQNLARSPLYHVTSRVFSPRGSGRNRAVLTILADPSVVIWNASICKLGDQIELVSSTPNQSRRK